MLFNEPKLLKFEQRLYHIKRCLCFSALQRAEIAEIHQALAAAPSLGSFSALQRAEIAEIQRTPNRGDVLWNVSVLFNEPKLLKLMG